MRRFLHNRGLWLRRYGISILVLAVALISARGVLAADNETSSTVQTLQGLIGGIIASTIVQVFTQARNLRTASKADQTEKKVNTLARELGVDNPEKATPDITKMNSEITEVKSELETVKRELITTLTERDTARVLAATQVEKNAQDMVSAQGEIDQLKSERDGEREVSARLERQLTDYDKRFHEQELKLARIEGRLDQQAVQDSLGNTMQTVAKLLNDVANKLVTTAQPEGITP